MSNEEKQAIEKIKKDLEEKKLRGDYKWKTGFYENGYIERVLNLIEKEKEKNKNARDYIYDLLNNDDIINIGIDDMKIILDILEE